jgi:hypothetical protein
MLAQNTVLKELDLSSQKVGNYGYPLDATFVKEFAVGISNNGALSVANILGNAIGKEQLSKLQEIMRSKPNLISLCGIADDATEADLSGLGMDAEDAIVLASELPDKRALSVLNLASNNLGGWNGQSGSHRQDDTSGNTNNTLLFHISLRTYPCRHYRPGRCHPRYGGIVDVYLQRGPQNQ